MRGRTRRRSPVGGALRAATLALAVLGSGCGRAPRLALDPVPLEDDDRYDIPAPKERAPDDYWDLLDASFFKQFEQAADLPRNLRKVAGKPKQALNATPQDEVRNSTWFTNRIGLRKPTPAELRQGPNRALGPDVEHPWTIVRAKTQGVTPGFTIEDGRGDKFVIKFDPPTDPELATGAEAIGTRLFWALGYNVPENYLVRFRPEELRIGPKATVKLELGRKRPMNQADLDVILAKVPRQADGRIRCIASRLLAGTPLGPTPFLDVRRDDPNDVVRHEHRRELRGYKVFCAWLNHNDSREINSLDMFVEEEGRHFVRHYLIDFGAILGSASTAQNLPSEGSEYIFDLGEMGKSLVTLGLYQRPWTRVEYPRLPGVGKFEAAHFHPATWKANYPNPAFENTTARDGFWAAKLVARFDDALLRAAIESAEFSDPRATEYLVRALAERRDRITRFWFGRLNPLDEFEIVQAPAAGKPQPADGGDPAGEPALRFADLAVRHGCVPPRRYDVLVRGPHGRLAAFEAGAPEIALGGWVRALGSPPVTDVAGRLLRLSIRSRLPDLPAWTPKVDVTLYLHPSGTLRVAAIERDE